MQKMKSMDSSEEKTIELSKTKLLLLIFGSLAFIGLGAWMVSLDAAQIEAQRRFNDPMFVHGIGWLAIAFFGWCGVIGIRKFFDKMPGLIFSSAGITDNSSGVSAGLIPWSDIIGFNIYEIQKQKMLIVLVKNPDIYIEIGSVIKRSLNRANYKMCGSPIAISSNSLKINFDELLKLSNEYFTKYGNTA
jgi:hypothetical protein